MPSAEAKRKHEALLAELRQGTSWLNMYQITAKHLKQYNGKDKKVHEASQYVVVAAARRKHEELVTLLQNGTSWLNMCQTTVTACDELSSSRGREELAAAASLTYEMHVFWRFVLCEMQDETQTCTA